MIAPAVGRGGDVAFARTGLRSWISGAHLTMRSYRGGRSHAPSAILERLRSRPRSSHGAAAPLPATPTTGAVLAPAPDGRARSSAARAAEAPLPVGAVEPTVMAAGDDAAVDDAALLVAPEMDAASAAQAAFETDLLRRCQAGDEAAFAVLVETFRERAFWVAYQMTGDMHESRDMVQDAFLRVYRSISSFELGKNFFTWLYRIVANLAIDSLRRGKSRQAVPLDALAEVEADVPAPHRIAAARELSAEVRAVLDRLPERYRQVLVLRDLVELSCKEIGVLTGSKHATVRWQLHQARKLFKDAWEGRAPDASRAPDESHREDEESFDDL